ncbi:hypothetical protein WJX75_007366 [Coccomyxa subellipsoidea]|uniref:U3 small nucleolar RNA-associated protein 25 n=1 Tax=Coccomyxa subellipsoidea TaxID=248742 RepID=A0ABR2Z1V8_9CHLO
MTEKELGERIVLPKNCQTIIPRAMGLTAAKTAPVAAGVKKNGNALRPPSFDYFTQHFDRKLSQEEVAQLRSTAPEFAAAEGVLPVGVWPGASCQITGSPVQEAPLTLAHAGVQPRLVTRWRECHRAKSGARQAPKIYGPIEAEEEGVFVSPEQRAFFGLCASYKDIFFPLRPYPTITSSLEDNDAIMDAYLLHCINHVSTAATLIKKNNEKLKAGASNEEDAFRDQGFTRAKVLILLPLRSVALRVVSRLLELAQKENRADSIQNKQRFLEDFGIAETDDEDDQDGGTDNGGAKTGGGRGGPAGGTPAEHAALFGGNSDDHFRLGIKVTRGAIKLYSDFLQSDIIVASPLALTTVLAEPPPEGGGAPGDFLSAIEIAVVDRADVLLMQNWAHVVTVFEEMNKTPKSLHDSDITRVRKHFMNGDGPAYRQTMVLSSLTSAEMNALLNRACSNWAGRVRLRVDHQGVLGQVIPQVRQMFERLPAPTAAADADARFEHFRANLWPRMKETGAKGQLVFVSSYFDYVRLRNFLKEEDAAFAGLSEYAAPKHAARGRSLFADGRLPLALLTERSHFYNRARVRGVKDLLFYQLPIHSHFYPEMVNLLRARDESAMTHATVSVLFTRFDALRLEPIVGGSRARKMLKSSTGTFLFC